MATIITRAGKGSRLTTVEMDANLNNLNNDKLEVATAASTYQPLDADLTAISALATTGYAKRTGVGTWAISATVAGSDITGAIDSVTVGLTTPAAARVTSLLVNAASFTATEVLRVGGAVSITGRIGIGTNFNTAYLAFIGGGSAHPDTATTIYGLVSDYTGPATATAAASGFTSTMRSTASAYTVGTFLHFDANLTSKGAGSTITSVFGFRANSSIATGTNNYGFYSNIASAATTWQIYMAGTAGNYIASDLRIATASLVGSEKLRVAGVTNTDGLIVNSTFVVRPSSIGSLDDVVIGGISSQAATFSTVGVRATLDATYSLKVGTPNSTAISLVGVGLDAIAPSTNTSTLDGFKSTLSTAVAAFTLSDLSHVHVYSTSLGAGSTVTNAYGFRVSSTFAGATNNYGFHSGITAATNNYGLYFSGTAKNYLNGELGVKFLPDTASSILIGIPSTTSTVARGVQAYLQATTFHSGSVYGFQSTITSATAVYTLSEAVHFDVFSTVKGAGSTISASYGFRVSNNLAVGTFNYGFYSSINSATNTFQFYGSGTAQSYFGGNVVMLNGTTFGWGTAGAPDTMLERASAGIIEQKNGASAQAHRIYGTTTGPKYLSLSHDGTNAIIDTSASSGRVSIGGNATSIFGLSHLLFTDNTFDIGASGATRPRSGYFSASITVGTSIIVGASQVVASRDTGWSAMTGTTNKATVYDTATVTLAQLAGRVMAMQAALTTHGLLGA